MLITAIQEIIPNLTSKVNQRSKVKSRGQTRVQLHEQYYNLPQRNQIIHHGAKFKPMMMERLMFATSTSTKVRPKYWDGHATQHCMISYAFTLGARPSISQGKQQVKLKANIRHQVKHTEGQTPVQGQKVHTHNPFNTINDPAVSF